MPTHIGLSDERAEQLKMLAQHLGVSSAEAIGYLLNMAFDRGVIPRVVPGFKIEALANGILFEVTDPDDQRSGMLMAFATMGTGYNDVLSVEDARELAVKLDRISTDHHYKPSFEPMAPYSLARVGTGIRIKTFTKKKRVIPKDVAREVAAMLRAAADAVSQS